MVDPTMSFRSIYPTRMVPGSSPLFPPPPQRMPPSPPPGLPLLPPQPYLNTSLQIGSFPAQCPGQLVNDYFVSGHVLPGNSRYSHSNSGYSSAPHDPNFTCLSAQVGRGFPNGNASCSQGQDGVDDVSDMSLHNLEEGFNWGRR